MSSPSVALDGFTNPMEGAERLPDGIDAETLRKYFTLTKPDLEEGEQCGGAINLGFAIQLCTLRWQGYFPSIHSAADMESLIDSAGLQTRLTQLDRSGPGHESFT